MKITHDAAACAVFAGIQQVNIVRGCNEILTGDVGVVGDGGNSTFQALNLAIQFGARRILMVGVDMRLDRGIHWHGRHGVGLNNPREENIVKWRRVLDGVAGAITKLGVDVVNCSPVSTLTAYPIVDFSEAIHQC
ncbi:hypothetical protein ACSVBT_07040 [Afipia sp. TerB]